MAGSPAQLNQVFLNLLVNAMQAIESTHRDRRPDRDHHPGEGRRGRRRGGRQRLRDPRRDLAADLRSVLHDQGGRRRHRIGALSITHSMVQDHGGRLEVESVPGQGTRFRVFLPVDKATNRLPVD